VDDASRSPNRSRAPSILLSSVLPEFRPGASILSTIIEEDEDSESLADTGSFSERMALQPAVDVSVPSDLLPGEVVIKVKQVNDTTVMVTQTTNVDGALRKKSVKYECVDKSLVEERSEPSR
jgi:hypothetical protein